MDTTHNYAALRAKNLSLQSLIVVGTNVMVTLWSASDKRMCIGPKGHSIEQFRMYEAAESGSIPVFAMNGDCTSKRTESAVPSHAVLFIGHKECLYFVAVEQLDCMKNALPVEKS